MNYPRGQSPHGARRRPAQAAHVPQKRRSKYGAVKALVGNRTFASKAEARRYVVLRARQAAGEISVLSTHPQFELHAPTGEVIGVFVADFSYYDGEGRIGVDGKEDRTLPLRFVVEDVKGMQTLPLARWKQKHFKAEYGLTVEEIRGTDRWPKPSARQTVRKAQP